MNRIISVVLISLSLLGLGACKSTNSSGENAAIDAAHNSRNSVDWPGVYTGIIPAASGPGINVTFTVNENSTYTISYQYIDKGNEVFTESGAFEWDEQGGKIKIDSKTLPPYYLVGENRLIQLDMQGNKITGELAENYVLAKKPE
jgi:uncharacterized lipoprotein NlpE involved in copper resistance